ncbi:hypothetical protein B0H14DRAFT_2592422 [Mycena olivaceomarginata]|nr:hypothetical protein B0H14DRAFT_2592422 [Mycena olivaceomarginata]
MPRDQFSRPQNDNVEFFLPECEKELGQGEDGAALKKRKQAKVFQIWDSPLFVNLDLEKNPRKIWFEACKSLFCAHWLTQPSDDCPKVEQSQKPSLFEAWAARNNHRGSQPVSQKVESTVQILVDTR